MIKRIIKIFLSIIVFGVLTFLIQQVVSKTLHKREVAQMLESMPEFNFITLEGAVFTRNNLETDKPTIFIYFNSTCDYCRHEAHGLSAHLPEFEDVQLVFVSTESVNVIREFARTYRLLNKDHVKFLQDPDWVFATRFDANTIPFLLIYDKNQQLLLRHKGQMKVEKLLKILPN